MVDAHSNTYKQQKKLPCLQFAKDNSCPRGKEWCFQEHHDKLHPNLVETRANQNYMVPNVPGEACQRCISTARRCDKLNRDPGPEDPCSECRWFGGANCNCSIPTHSTYNDQLWSQMIGRWRSGYDLAALKGSMDPKNGKTPQPMPDTRLKTNWTGETRDALLAKPDFLPPGVRACPRAYLVPPRETADHAKKAAKREARNVATDIPSPAPTTAPMQHTGLPPRLPAPLPPPTLPSSLAPLPPPTFDRPPADRYAGSVIESTYNWQTKQWSHQYANGSVVMTPSQRRPQFSIPSQPIFPAHGSLSSLGQRSFPPPPQSLKVAPLQSPLPQSHAISPRNLSRYDTSTPARTSTLLNPLSATFTPSSAAPISEQPAQKKPRLDDVQPAASQAPAALPKETPLDPDMEIDLCEDLVTGTTETVTTETGFAELDSRRMLDDDSDAYVSDEE